MPIDWNQVHKELSQWKCTEPKYSYIRRANGNCKQKQQSIKLHNQFHPCKIVFSFELIATALPTKFYDIDIPALRCLIAAHSLECIVPFPNLTEVFVFRRQKSSTCFSIVRCVHDRLKIIQHREKNTKMEWFFFTSSLSSFLIFG